MKHIIIDIPETCPECGEEVTGNTCNGCGLTLIIKDGKLKTYYEE
jgi:hypothetical protein